MSQPENEAGGLTRTLKDLFAGAAGGVAQVLLGEHGVCLIDIWKNLKMENIHLCNPGIFFFWSLCCFSFHSCFPHLNHNFNHIFDPNLFICGDEEYNRAVFMICQA